MLWSGVEQVLDRNYQAAENPSSGGKERKTWEKGGFASDEAKRDGTQEEVL